MTDLDVFRATTTFHRPDRLLYYFGCVEDLDRRLKAHVGGDGDYGAHYGCWRSAGIGPRGKQGLTAPDYSRYYRGESLPAGAHIDGRGVASVPSGFYHFWGYVSPLRNAESLREIEEYPWPNPDDMDFTGMEAAAQSGHAAGRVVAGGIGHIYENAWQVRGYEQFLLDMVERPAWAECLLDRIAEVNRRKAVAAARAGADVLDCGDDVANQNAMMFSPDAWRRFMKPRWKRVWDAAREAKPDIQIKYHSDGNIMDVIPELIEIGVTILNPLQPECMDVDAVHRRWGDRLVFDGCIGTQSTMPFGTPQDVTRRVSECIEKYASRGGLILAPTHVLEPEVPIANIEAFADACRKYA
jgi:uroporphyrinogen decarboxylase